MEKSYEYDTPQSNASAGISFSVENLTQYNKSNSEISTEFKPYNMVHLLAMSICMGLIIVITIIGNVFVIVAIVVEKNLQNVQNHLILSLSVADLMVAALVMPLAVLDQVSQNWFLGAEVCDMWVSFDVICCTSSILHLVCIALDRYWSITKIDYMRSRTSKTILLMIAASWVISVCISIPPLFGWKDDSNHPDLTGRCVISQNLGYTVYSTMGAFYLPLLFIIIIYCKIYRAAKSRIRRRHFQAYKDIATNLKPLIAHNLNGEHVSLVTKHLDTAATTNGSTQQTPLMPIQTNASPESSTGSQTQATENNKNKSEISTPPISPAIDDAKQHDKKSSSILDITKTYLEIKKLPNQRKKKQELDKKEKIRSERERKAARTLAIITGTFIFCWLPFFIWSLVRPFCGEKCNLPIYVITIIVWLGYMNSLLNPVIYTIFNPDFRMAFQKILFGQYKSR